MLGTLEHHRQRFADRLEAVQGIAGDERAHGGAADDQHFMGNSFNNRTKRSARNGEATENHDQQNNDTNCSEHRITPGI